MLLDFFSEVVKSYLAILVIWFITFIIVLISLFKRNDIFLPVKLFWGFIIFIAPVIGLIFYLIYGLKGKKKLFPNTDKNIRFHKNDII